MRRTQSCGGYPRDLGAPEFGREFAILDAPISKFSHEIALVFQWLNERRFATISMSDESADGLF